jgi:hypothetical protein
MNREYQNFKKNRRLSELKEASISYKIWQQDDYKSFFPKV